MPFSSERCRVLSACSKLPTLQNRRILTLARHAHHLWYPSQLEVYFAEQTTPAPGNIDCFVRRYLWYAQKSASLAKCMLERPRDDLPSRLPLAAFCQPLWWLQSLGFPCWECFWAFERLLVILYQLGEPQLYRMSQQVLRIWTSIFSPTERCFWGYPRISSQVNSQLYAPHDWLLDILVFRQNMGEDSFRMLTAH